MQPVRHGLFLLAAIVLSLAVAACGQGEGSKPLRRDWLASPAIVEVNGASDVWVLGDVHGDYGRMVGLMATAGLIAPPATPTDAVWRGGTAILVFVGDAIDKWDRGYDVLVFLQALAAASTASGGQVIVLMGNHEANFLADPDDEKVVEFNRELRVQGIAPADVAAGRNALGRFLRGLPLAARIDQWFFVHAGNTGHTSIRDLALAILQGVEANGFGAEVLAHPASLLEAEPPWWESDGQEPEIALRSRVLALGVDHIVQGHKPGKIDFADGTSRPAGSIYAKYGLVYFADVGMSRGVGDSEGALLRVSGGAAEVFHANGSTGSVEQ
jgi:hypothetical protein